MRIGDIDWAWIVKDQLVVGLRATLSLATGDKPPTMEKSDKPGVACDIDLGRAGKHQEIESAARTVWGLVSLFTTIDIAFDEVDREWIPETDEERQALKLSSFSSKTERYEDEPRTIGFDLIARAMLAATDAREQEVPLEFLRRGTIAMHDGEYSLAFYNFFFYLETLFAPGFSSPKQVKAKLWAAKPVQDAVTAMKRTPPRKEFLEPKGKALWALTDQALVDHLVDVRGQLHHHALRRPGVWHPGKQQAYREEVLLLADMVHEIARRHSLSVMFDAIRDEGLMSAARAAGAISSVRIVAFAHVDGREQELPSVVVEVPTLEISAAATDSTHRLFRELYENTGEEVARYELRSYDGTKVYATWRRAIHPRNRDDIR